MCRTDVPNEQRIRDVSHHVSCVYMPNPKGAGADMKGRDRSIYHNVADGNSNCRSESPVSEKLINAMFSKDLKKLLVM